MNAINVDSMAAERQAFADLARDISLKKLVEHREENDRYPFGPIFEDAIRDAGIVGFYGVNLPEEQGGVGMNAGMVSVILEKISEVDASLAGVIFSNAAALEIINAAMASTGDTGIYSEIKTLGTAPIAFPMYASPDEISPAMLSKDESRIFYATIRNCALGNIADYAVVPIRRKENQPYSYYLVDLKDKGVTISRPIVSLGLHGCPMVDITIDKVPSRVIGKSGEGKKYFSAMSDRMAVCAAAMSLGIMRGSFQDAMQYTSDRYQGGRQIIDWGQVRMMLANMAIEMKIAESCVAMACQQMDCCVCGWEKTAQAAAIHIGEMATRSCTDGVQLFGGNGYMKDYPQEKRMRDARHAQSLLGMVPLRKIQYISRIIEECE
ncbi:MAG: acyl-CoA/acyl-ACP dehydrogenase [Spirochaetes bacterium]|nr:acyl-CoA/acyl-ACP dehydrogenase [Spirochaetota bacterium]